MLLLCFFPKSTSSISAIGVTHSYTALVLFWSIYWFLSHPHCKILCGRLGWERLTGSGSVNEFHSKWKIEPWSFLFLSSIPTVIQSKHLHQQFVLCAAQYLLFDNNLIIFLSMSFPHSAFCSVLQTINSGLLWEVLSLLSDLLVLHFFDILAGTFLVWTKALLTCASTRRSLHIYGRDSQAEHWHTLLPLLMACLIRALL